LVRVDAPPFDISSDDGALRVSEESPRAIHSLIGRVVPDQVTWSDVRIAGGPKGIVAARSAIDGTTGSWVYDLWLCEHIAHALELPRLKQARIGPISPGRP
jgi:hypothetical protein